VAIDTSPVEHAPVLHEGATGEWVTYLQQLLEKTGNPPGAINGRFGSSTKAALKKFQKDHSNASGENGTVGPNTWKALYTSASIIEGSYIQGYDATIAHDRDFSHGDAHELGVGREVGHKGWQAGSITLSVVDFRGQVHNGNVYLRFADEAGDASDESGETVGGHLALPHIWMPCTGWLHLTIAVRQDPVDHATANFKLPAWKNHLDLYAYQDFEPHKMTRHEVEQRGWSEEAKLHGGINLEVVEIGADGSWGRSGSSQHGMDEEILVLVAKPTLTISATPIHREYH
jgi:Putative peptidoglycan binding domain